MNTVDIAGGNGTLATAQTVAWYYVPWNSPRAVPANGPLKLSVACDRVQLEVGAKVTCNVLAERVGSSGHRMMIAEIGIPPGVDVDRESLQRQMTESGWDLSSFEVLPDRVVAYVWLRAGGTKFAISFTARMGIEALSAPYTLFDYYNPDASVTLAAHKIYRRGALRKPRGIGLPVEAGRAKKRSGSKWPESCYRPDTDTLSRIAKTILNEQRTNAQLSERPDRMLQ
jgi:hypothetical protein